MRATGLTLDTGALIAVERGDARVRALLRRADEHELPIVVPATVVAQAWRGGARQVRIASLLGSRQVDVEPLDHPLARAVGAVCGRTGHSDIVDVQVAVVGRRKGHTVVTSDPDDIASIDPALAIIAI